MENIFTTSQHLTLTFDNSLPLPTTLHQLFVNWSSLTDFSNPNVKIKKFLTLNQNHIQSSLLYFFFLCLYARNFFRFVEKSPHCGNSFYPFIMEHRIYLSPDLKPRLYNYYIYYQLLVLSVRSRHHLVTKCL